MTCTTPKTVVLGIDGLDWAGLDARIAAGTAPGFAALAGRGVRGRLLSDSPAPATIVWATLATGLPPEAHGIVAADEPWEGGIRPVTRASWTSAPLWQRLSAAGLRTASVGWPAAIPGASWPGLHVDERLAVAGGIDWDDWPLPRGVAPDGLCEDLRALRVHPRDITGAMLAKFVPDLAAVDQQRDHRLVDLALILARFSTTHAAVMALLQRDDWDVAMVRLDFLATVIARFGDAAPPCAGVVDAAWSMLDAVINATVASFPDATTVILVSPGESGRAGSFVAKGPGVPAATRIDGVHDRDIAPTVLGRYGLADDALTGRARLGSVATPRPAPEPAPDRMVAPNADDLARAAAFGHLPVAPPTDWQARRLTMRAQMLLGSDPEAAGRLAEAALACGPDTVTALGVLAAARFMADDIAQLPAIADRVAAIAPNHLWESLIRGGYHAARRENALAIVHLRRFDIEGGPLERMRAAGAWLMLERHADAARLFELVLAEMPDNVSAMVGLATRPGVAPHRAEALFRRALAIDPYHLASRRALADLLRRRGRGEEAARLALTDGGDWPGR